MKFHDTENRETGKGRDILEKENRVNEAKYDIVIQYDNMNDHGNINK